MHTLEKVDLFLAHSNPSFKSNGNNREGHRGFESFGRYIKEKQPRLFLHGHLHERYETQYKETTIHSVYLYKQMTIFKSS
jgi:Icc-related predicted phosphoesterase